MRNSGIAFGILPGRIGVVSILTVIAVAWMLVHFARSGSRHVLFPVALGLLVGGSLSNLIDRVAHGHVTDFIDISHWPTFNLADTFIVIGVACCSRPDRVEPAARSATRPPSPNCRDHLAVAAELDGVRLDRFVAPARRRHAGRRPSG